MTDRRGFMKGAAALAASGFASAQDASTLVVRNAAHVLTMDPKLGNLADADVHIRDGRIIAIGRNLAAVSGQMIDARGMIVMPGLIDTHTHMWNCLWRTLDTPYIYGHSNLGPQYRPEDSYNAVRLCAAEFLFGGITTVHAWEHNVRSPAHADAELKALTDMGMRTHYSYGYYHHLPADQPMNLEDILRLRRQWQGETVTVGYDSSNPDNQLINNLIQTQLAAAGLTAKVQSYPTSEIYGWIGTDAASAPDILTVTAWPDAPSPYTWGHISWDADGGLNYLGCSAPPITTALAQGLETAAPQPFSQAADAASQTGCWLNIADVDDFVVAQPWLKGVEQAHVVTNPNSLRLAALSVG